MRLNTEQAEMMLRRAEAPLLARIEALEDKLLRATSIGMSTILTRCGAYGDLSPYLRGKYDELSAMALQDCGEAGERNRASAENNQILAKDRS